MEEPPTAHANTVRTSVQLQFQKPALKLTVFPNPCMDQATVTVNANGGRYSVHDAKGQMVMRNTFTSSVLLLSTGTLEPGMYMLEVVTEIGTETTKFTKLP